MWLPSSHDVDQRGTAWSVSRPIDTFAVRIATLAVEALVAEANLTPKPGLVDARGSGAHADLDIDLMHRSARSLFPCFREIATATIGAEPSRDIRETLATIGRDGEMAMFAATGGINTHKGAVWALGLLTAGGAICAADPADPTTIATVAGKIARHPDNRVPDTATNGSRVTVRYGVSGARGEAHEGFPHVVKIGLPALWEARSRGIAETNARLDALLSIMAKLDDTCLLHRGGLAALEAAKKGASSILQAGGTSTDAGRAGLALLDAELMKLNASPGGSGDLLAATLFLDSLTHPSADVFAGIDQHGVSQSWKY